MNEILSKESFRNAKEMVYCGCTPEQDRIHAEQTVLYVKILESTVEALGKAVRWGHDEYWASGDWYDETTLLDGDDDLYNLIGVLREEGWFEGE